MSEEEAALRQQEQEQSAQPIHSPPPIPNNMEPDTRSSRSNSDISITSDTEDAADTYTTTTDWKPESNFFNAEFASIDIKTVTIFEEDERDPDGLFVPPSYVIDRTGFAVDSPVSPVEVLAANSVIGLSPTHAGATDSTHGAASLDAAAAASQHLLQSEESEHARRVPWTPHADTGAQTAKQVDAKRNNPRGKPQSSPTKRKPLYTPPANAGKRPLSRLRSQKKIGVVLAEDKVVQQEEEEAAEGLSEVSLDVCPPSLSSELHSYDELFENRNTEVEREPHYKKQTPNSSFFSEPPPPSIGHWDKSKPLQIIAQFDQSPQKATHSRTRVHRLVCKSKSFTANFESSPLQHVYRRTISSTPWNAQKAHAQTLSTADTIVRAMSSHSHQSFDSSYIRDLFSPQSQHQRPATTSAASVLHSDSFHLDTAIAHGEAGLPTVVPPLRSASPVLRPASRQWSPPVLRSGSPPRPWEEKKKRPTSVDTAVDMVGTDDILSSRSHPLSPSISPRRVSVEKGLRSHQRAAAAEQRLNVEKKMARLDALREEREDAENKARLEELAHRQSSRAPQPMFTPTASGKQKGGPQLSMAEQWRLRVAEREPYWMHDFPPREPPKQKVYPKIRTPRRVRDPIPVRINKRMETPIPSTPSGKRVASPWIHPPLIPADKLGDPLGFAYGGARAQDNLVLGRNGFLGKCLRKVSQPDERAAYLYYAGDGGDSGYGWDGGDDWGMG